MPRLSKITMAILPRERERATARRSWAHSGTARRPSGHRPVQVPVAPVDQPKAVLLVVGAGRLDQPLARPASPRPDPRQGRVWTAPVILEALIPGRMQSHVSTAEVPRGAARARGQDGVGD